MDKKLTISRKRKLATTLILLFCVAIVVCVSVVLLFVYKPSQNSLGALSSVSMDVICMIVLMILTINLVIEKYEMNRTTKLFLALMLGTLEGLIFDFLTWALDGSLGFGQLNFVFVVTSLCTGSILAFILSLYLGSYMDDMYDLKSAQKVAKICAICNAIAFCITLTLALTHTAFTFVDGHYEVGALYDVVTVIPVLTIVVMAIYAIRNVKVIGSHDVFAVVGYILTMIIGALVEAAYTIGTTYVAIAAADVFIFVMLQNKLIDRVKKQREILAEQITSQYEILKSMSGIYSYVNYVDLEQAIAGRFDVEGAPMEPFNIVSDPHTSLNKGLLEGIVDEHKDDFWAYTDLSTLNARMNKEKLITAEFRHVTEGWLRIQYIRIGESIDAPIKKVIYAIRNINEEKKNVEKWIRKSNTDELTDFYNRHAYEEEMARLGAAPLPEDFVYISIDVNGLKVVNDTFGHDAGDELLIGACECMRKCFGIHGNLYRTGGDEFVALLSVDEDTLASITKAIVEETEQWHGKLNERLAISCGCVTSREATGMTPRQMAVLADKRMYENKNDYYKKNGIDRRGHNFVTAVQIHPEDMDEYLTKTNPEYVINYLENHTEPLQISYRGKLGDEYEHIIMELHLADK